MEPVQKIGDSKSIRVLAFSEEPIEDVWLQVIDTNKKVWTLLPVLPREAAKKVLFLVAGPLREGGGLN